MNDIPAVSLVVKLPSGFSEQNIATIIPLFSDGFVTDGHHKPLQAFSGYIDTSCVPEFQSGTFIVRLMDKNR